MDALHWTDRPAEEGGGVLLVDRLAEGGGVWLGLTKGKNLTSFLWDPSRFDFEKATFFFFLRVSGDFSGQKPEIFSASWALGRPTGYRGVKWEYPPQRGPIFTPLPAGWVKYPGRQPIFSLCWLWIFFFAFFSLKNRSNWCFCSGVFFLPREYTTQPAGRVHIHHPPRGCRELPIQWFLY